ncbi:bifunctional lysylphosphatidylglycerol flippase/synthetase MprF [Levilactobacillus andaensis]|uniref:bifunctional lysylphosphatidylglycerol flippase/synthetase MprF n=1 Tax=Levilactobacillus andaensis TaxID=2799570 RepID=UPI0019422F78|nr:bifunctional lysylphosphatidylglycerol flippase/synthetase MprF [Levilactobacillus andaensis]
MGKGLWGRIQRHLTLIKGLFMFSILIFIIQAVGRVAKEVNGQDLRAELATLNTGTLLLLLVCGFIAVLPMLVYDFTIVEFLPGKFSRGYIVRSGWTTNTFTNLAGMGGLLGASLRANFYAKAATKKQVVYAISKIALFLLAGLSLSCWVALIMLFGFDIGQPFRGYWVWLLGGGLYFPGVFVFTRLSNGEFFHDLTLKREMKLIIGSSLEWGSCALFFLLIGWALGLPISLAAVFPMFVVASVAGVVSMIPGGLGSFDVFMIIGLGFLGVSRADATGWLLLYRLFYYLLPFAVGVGFFIHDVGHRVNEFLNGLPVTIMRRGAHLFVTTFMYFSGVMMLLFATIPDVVLANRLYMRLIPYMFYFLSQMSNIIMAFLLIGLARGVGARVKRAFWPTLVVLVVAIVITLWRENFPVGLAILLGLVLACLLFARPELYRTSLNYSWGGLLVDGSIYVGTFILYTILGISSMQIGTHHHHSFLPNAWLLPSTQVWLNGLGGLLVALLILIGIYRYLSSGRPKWLQEPYDAPRMRAIIAKFGGNEVSHLAFLRDKQAYFYQVDGADQLFLLYRQEADKLMVMGEPIGNQAVLEPALKAFMHDADQAGLRPVFYEISETLTLRLHEMGFDFIKVGEEGHVDLQTFKLSGKARRGERALINKFQREGYQFDLLQPPLSDEQFNELQAISASWLNDETEKGFSMGFFDRDYLNEAPVAVMHDAQGKIVAFANLMPTGERNMTSIDLMRASHDAPSGIMDGLFVYLFETCRDQGYQSFNLGMAPLANVGMSEFSFIEERAAHLIYEYGYNFYSFQGLRAYKEKYVTEWQPKYLAYRKRQSLIFSMLQLLLIINRRPNVTPQFVPKWLNGWLVDEVRWQNRE